MNIDKLERILNHQQHLHFNFPYDDDYYSDYRSAAERAEKAEEKLKNLWDIPIQTELGDKFPFTGYVEIDGTVHKCNSCEHEKLTRDLVYNVPEHFKRYLNVPAVFYDRKPQGMLQEEYFLMKYLGFVSLNIRRNSCLDGWPEE